MDASSRRNAVRCVRDLDDPAYAVEDVDVEAFSAGRVKAAKSYQVDLAFPFWVDD